MSYRFPEGLPVRIVFSGNMRAAAANAVAVTLYTVDGAVYTLGAAERLLIHWVDVGDATDGQMVILDGAGTGAAHMLGDFGSRQIGTFDRPMVGLIGTLPKVYMPALSDNTAVNLVGGGSVVA